MGPTLETSFCVARNETHVGKLVAAVRGDASTIESNDVGRLASGHEVGNSVDFQIVIQAELR